MRSNATFPESIDLDVLRSILDVLPAAVFVKDALGKLLYINSRCEEVWGVKSDDILLTDGSAIFPDNKMQRFRAQDEEVFAKGEPEEFEEIFWNARLSRNRIGKTVKRPFYDSNGKPAYLVSVTQDITAQAEAETQTRRAHKVALVALADLAEFRDTDTSEHVLRVARMSHEITRQLRSSNIYSDEIDDSFYQSIGLASILHDVGKVGVPDNILLKPGKLSPDEWIVMETHTLTGGNILNKAEQLLQGSVPFKLASEIAVGHHEHWSGKGYPHALCGQAIPLAARIVAVADVFDALTSKRPYKEAWSVQEATSYIGKKSGEQFDPVVVEAFLKVLAERSKTKTIAWSEEMAVDHGVIDHDHKMLLALVDQVQSPENQADPVAIEFVLDELVGYTMSHFAREEEFMEKIGYPELERHRELHRNLVEDVQRLRQRQSIQDDACQFGEDLSGFLANWLVNHILQEDKKIEAYNTASHP